MGSLNGGRLQSKELFRPPTLNDHHLARITALDPTSTPFWRSPPSGPGLCDASMPAWPPVSLASPGGVPLAIKATSCTKGIRPPAQRMLEKLLVPPTNPPFTERLWQAGAVAVWGKPTSTSSPWAASTATPSHPRDFAFWPQPQSLGTPSGCQAAVSGGSAAAVAAGEAHGSLGSDTAGFDRQPRLLLRRGRASSPPTAGVSRGVFGGLRQSLDQVGPSAPASPMAAALLQVIAGAIPVMAPAWMCCSRLHSRPAATGGWSAGGLIRNASSRTAGFQRLAAAVIAARPLQAWAGELVDGAAALQRRHR